MTYNYNFISINFKYKFILHKSIITFVCNSLCKMKAPTNPVAPVRSTLPLENLFLFRFTDLQND